MSTFDDLTHAEGPESGIIWAYHFDADGEAQRIEGEKISDMLARPEGWIWVHLALSNHRCRDWLAERAPLSPAARQILSDPDEHLRLDMTGKEIFGIITDLQQALIHPTEELVRLHFAMTDRLLFTARRRQAHAAELTRRAIESGRLFPTPISLLDGIIDQFAHAVDHMLEILGNDLDQLEQHVLHEELGDERARLGQIRLQAVRLQRQLAQLRSLFHRIEPRLAQENSVAALAIGGVTQKIDALAHDAAAVHERTRLLLDEVAGKMAGITNQRLFTLSVLTACLLPPTLITGFFGMNTDSLPFQQIPGGTWYAAGLAIAAGVAAYWAVARLK